MSGWVLCGDALEVMARLPDNSVEAVVTDPPYGLSFMGKQWDHGVPGAAFWCEALRVAKPGARLLAMGGTRTFHRLVCAIEDAGWRVMDTLCWMYGSGFPKSRDISKAIDKEAGAEREVVGSKLGQPGYADTENTGRMLPQAQGQRNGYLDITTPATPAAHQWNGWGTALKPAVELICMAMKPLDGTYAQNTLRHGCGGINVDGCRISTEETQYFNTNSARSDFDGHVYGFKDYEAMRKRGGGHEQGRWPPNVILDPQSAEMLDRQSEPQMHNAGYARPRQPQTGDFGIGEHGTRERMTAQRLGDTGGASRFFYTAKASRAERNAGLEGLASRNLAGANKWTDVDYRRGTGEVTARPQQNFHPTVKPLALMRWLVRLVTPPGGCVLDPFAGSGTTGIAAHQEGMHYLLIDNDAESCDIARRRIAHWLC